MNVWLPLFIGLAGALIGAAASIITVIVQARYEGTRNRTALVADLAVKETEFALRIIQHEGRPGKIPPPVVYMHYYDEILKAIDEGNFDGEKYRAVCEGNRRFIEITKEVDAEADAEDEGNEAFRQARDV